MRKIAQMTIKGLKKLIQPVLIQLVGHSLCSDKGGTRYKHNGDTGRLAKVTNTKLKKLI